MADATPQTNLGSVIDRMREAGMPVPISVPDATTSAMQGVGMPVAIAPPPPTVRAAPVPYTPILNGSLSGITNAVSSSVPNVFTQMFTGAAQAGKANASAGNGFEPGTGKAFKGTVAYGGNGEMEPSTNGQYDVGVVGQPRDATPQELALAAKHLGVTPDQAHSIMNAHLTPREEFIQAATTMPRYAFEAMFQRHLQQQALMSPQRQALQGYLDARTRLATNPVDSPDNPALKAYIAAVTPIALGQTGVLYQDQQPQ